MLFANVGNALFNRGPDAFSDAFTQSFIGSVQKHDEFLAAKSAYDVFLSAMIFERCGNIFNNPVADQMSERVVDLLEVINVDDQ